FQEDGVRVLYVLPRVWTDAALPMKLDPAPRELVRVMVGRAEVITPDAELSLRSALNAVRTGEAARLHALDQLKRLGRFATPTLRLIETHSGDTNAVAIGRRLLTPSFE